MRESDNTQAIEIAFEQILGIAPPAGFGEPFATAYSRLYNGNKEETKAAIRRIPVDSAVCEEEGKCIYTGKPSNQRVLFAISY